MGNALILLGLLGFIGFIITSIISLFKRNGKFKKSLKGILAAFIIMIIGGALNPSTNANKSISNKATSNTNVLGQGSVSKSSSKSSAKAIVTKSKTVKPAPKTIKVVDSKPSNSKSVTKTNGNLKVHYINVGQADSILIQQGSHSMLIDAGNNDDGTLVKNYLQKQGVSNLEFLIGTHPHEDHIGGVDYIINCIKVGKVYLPKATSNTKTFKDVVNAMKNKGIKATAPKVGESFKLGDAVCTIMAPNNSNYEDLNNYSIVVKVQFGDKAFLFTGDAEAVSEMEMVNKGLNLKADVLKVGHHGSNSSTCANFLNKVNPKYAVVSVGQGNTYKHPHKGTMDRLKNKGITVYRTDQCGTIVAVCDGKNVVFNSKSGDYTYRGEGTGVSGSSKSKVTSSKSTQVKVSNAAISSTVNKGTTSKKTSTTVKNTTSTVKKADRVQVTTKTSSSNPTVYVVGSGKKYHVAGCRYLHGSGRAIPLRDAKTNGYTPCKVCNPVQ